MTNIETSSPTPTSLTAAPTGHQGLVVPHDYSEFAGTGFENADHEKDLSVPFLEILQTNSKALVEGHAKYRPGCKAGMFLNTGTGELLDGKKGLAIVPLKIDHCVVEWTDQRKYVARYELDSPTWVEALAKFNASPDPKKRMSKDIKAPSGNSLVETYYLWAVMLDETGETAVGGVILPFKSTNIAIYRKQVYTPLYSFKGAGGKLFVHRVKVTLALEQRQDGNSFNYRFEPLKGAINLSLIDPKSDLMKVVYSTYQQVVKGEVKMAEPDEVSAASSGDAGAADEVFS